jgi:TIR domain
MEFSMTSYDVFVSHATTDASVARAVCEALEGSGLSCWLAPRDVEPGKSWPVAIVEGIGASRVLLVILSSHSNESQEVLREVEQASRMRKHLLAIRIEDTGPAGGLGYFLNQTQWLDAFPPPLQPRLAKLVHAVRSLLEVEEPSVEVMRAPEFVEVDLDDFGRSGPSRIRSIDRLFEDR